MAESTTGVLMSPGYGGSQSTTPPSYYATTTNDTTSYYTEAPKEPEYYTTTNAAPAYYTEAPKYYSAPSYYTEVSAYYTTETVEYYTEVIMVNNGLLLLGVESLMAGLTTGVSMSPGYGGYQTTTPASDCTTTTTYATTSYYTEASKYYTTNIPDCIQKHKLSRVTTQKPRSIILPRVPPPSHRSITQLRMQRQLTTPRFSRTTLLSATPPRLQLITPLTVENFTEVPKYYSAPSYTTLTEAAKYYVALTFYTTAAPSYYAEPKYYTEDPVCYTTTYATLCYYTEALK
ncbi:mucin-12-like [Daphnia pulex]|uniref:mucin-12-like n=1 Tax=Daphnia pulex TaxID=6669 RepID=UPI001EDCF9FC|nr:mucin-12-like [Daphnia pulex]XP_046450630.1 mucin-12-like [Daphnia pulex]XP_046450631.1 mucin-12-like [Daphnia pulex]XP_046450632.1 mucin-12-like [Daphnia pulex]